MSGRLVRLVDHRGRPVHVNPAAVLSVGPSIVGDACSSVVMTHGDARTISGDPDAVVAALRVGSAADESVLREMREVLAHIRREDIDTTEMAGSERGFRLLCDRLGLEWKP